MGGSLSSRPVWTARYGTQAAAAAGGGGGSNEVLASNPQNEQLLYELLALTQQIADDKTAADAEFVNPFQWASTVRPAAFKSSRYAAEYDVRETATVADKAGVSSKATRVSDGAPLLKLELGDGGVFLAKVSSFRQVQRLFELAGDGKLREIQQAIQSNRDPIANVAGVANAGPGKALMEVFQDLEKQSSVASEAARDRHRALFQLVLQLNAFDQKLLQSSVKVLQETHRLNMEGVREEVELLGQFAGSDDTSPLHSIDYESEYAFTNGCRAPPWRQVYGELAYIEVVPNDSDRFYVTATTEGYFVNGGRQNAQGSERLDYTKEGQVQPTLVALIKTKSDHFKKTIEQQRYVYEKALELKAAEEQNETTGKRGDAAEISMIAQHDDDDDDDDDALDDGAGGGGGKSAGKGGRGDKKGDKKGGAKKRRGRGGHGGGGNNGNNGKQTSGAAPSSRWKNLTDGEHQHERAAGGGKKKGGGRSGSPGKNGGGGGAGAGGAGADGTPKRSGSRGGGGGGGDDGEASQQQQQRPQDDEYSDSDADMSEEEEGQEKKRSEQNAELPPEYWQIQKLVKYLKGGNQTATIIALCSLRDFDMQNETNQLAIRDVGGLDVLINLLDTEDPKCKTGSLQILRDISQNYQIKKAIANLGGMQPLVELVKDSTTELKCLAAETIAHCAKYARNRRAIRRYGGIRKLVRLLKLGLQTDKDKGAGGGGGGGGGGSDDNVARCGALALWSCSKSAKNKEAIRNAGAVPLLASLLQSSNESLLIPVVGILQECATDKEYRVLIRTSGMIKPLVDNLASKNAELQMHCASAIFKCAEDPETRDLVREYGGLDPMVGLLSRAENKDLLSAATGAVWKCAASKANVHRFQELDTISQLVMLLSDQPEEVLINVVGALGECAKTPENRAAIRSAGGIPPLVNLLTGTNQRLLVNVTRAIGACANDAENMAIIDRLDGVRLLWSLLKSTNPEVQASAAWGICPCIDNAKDAGEMVRSFVGGLELIVSLLKSDNVEVLASVCSAIANIAKDEENLAVITDHGVVPMLAKLARTPDEGLRRHLAEAIARCCHWGNNKVAFGSAGAVAPLVNYLKSKDTDVHRSTARALYQLSIDAENCITMHESGVVALLLGMVGSPDESLQEASAGCIGNIRRLALASESAK